MIIVLLAVAFFVAAKFSFTRLRRNLLEDVELDEENKSRIEKLYKNPAMYLHSLQFIIVSLLCVVGYKIYPLSISFANMVNDLFANGSIYASIIGNIVFILLMAILVFVFAETIPKAIALSSPEKTFSFTSNYAAKLSYVVRPLVALLIFIAKHFLGMFKVQVLTEIDLVHSEDEIRTLVSHSHQLGAIDKVERELIDNVFDFVDRMAKEVMVPRQEVECLYVEDSIEETQKKIMQTRHTRYPLCLEDKDHVIGLIHVRDIMENEDKAAKDLRLVMRKILIVPEVMKLSVLLQHMRAQRTYQSVVVDEYGGMVGLVGLEDIVEELVGDIRDENEEPVQQIVHIGEGVYDFDGTTLIDDVEDTLGIEITDGDEDTLGGYIFGVLGQTPEVGNSIEHDGYLFTVKKLEGYRIARVEVTPIVNATKEGENTENECI